MAPSMEESLGRAAALDAEDRSAEASAERALAAKQALELPLDTSQTEKLMGGLAVLLHAKSMLESGASLEGLDNQLEAALHMARQGSRSRDLECQLLHTLSCVLLSQASPSSIDRAIEARQESAVLAVEAVVAELGWKAAGVKKAAKMAAEKEHSQLLNLAELFDALKYRLGASVADPAAEAMKSLFDAWASPSAGGPPVISEQDFLTRLASALAKVSAEDKAPDSNCKAPCEGGSGLSKLESEILALVAKEGASNWEEKLCSLQAVGLKGEDGLELTPDALHQTWLRIAPQIKKATEADEEMACGHSCSTCPTRHECQVHDALKDIEDL
eukprot:CAMPEP_0197658378 /NCGR_PEP_ID=MMETSP1338-20131121/45205_1 /TAXON_ID=43686 ORGANISM="Pelagodinium beii, Strain RCC1491" /NCGR_SAMPLE_ID=MMETSP1338 /ASSEMBLY_ACC=CAM_ASM_000754 /LENGTH=329 /DNA_ID=CAMNT_0043234959 /DNA_START=37 /DNA_END=1026 /DNA_ORIENTATION=-